VDDLLENYLVEEALLLAETKYALDLPRSKRGAEEVQCVYT